MILRAPQRMVEYWNNPLETAEALRPHDGERPWLHTGDLAYMDDDGYLFIVDRKKDLIKTSGFQVWPREIEEVISAHPAVHRGRRRRRSGSGERRGGQGVGRAQAGTASHRRRAARVLPRAARSLQGAGAESSSEPSCPRRWSARSCAARSPRQSDGRQSDRSRDADAACRRRSSACAELVWRRAQRAPRACRRGRRSCPRVTGTRVPSTGDHAADRAPSATARAATDLGVVDDRAGLRREARAIRRRDSRGRRRPRTPCAALRACPPSIRCRARQPEQDERRIDGCNRPRRSRRRAPVARRHVVQRAVRLHVLQPDALARRNGGQRANLVERPDPRPRVAAARISRRPKSAEVGKAGMRADRDAVLPRQRDRLAHGRRDRRRESRRRCWPR